MKDIGSAWGIQSLFIVAAVSPEIIGASLKSRARHVEGAHLGTYFRILGPLSKRLLLMRRSRSLRAMQALLDPDGYDKLGCWSTHLIIAHQEAMTLTTTLSEDKQWLANNLAPRESIIIEDDQPNTVDIDLLPTIDVEFFPKGAPSPIRTKGIKLVSTGMRRLGEWLRTTHRELRIRISVRVQSFRSLGEGVVGFSVHGGEGIGR